MNKINYDKKLKSLLSSLEKEKNKPSLLLHSCCAPCSSYVLEYLSEYFVITIYYYNPNISPESEFIKRAEEQKRLIGEMHLDSEIYFINGIYENRAFEKLSENYENFPEGGERCFRCYRLRLEKTAMLAKERNFSYFGTTLSVSPYKNAEKLNSIGKELSNKYDINYLYSDFKKNNGYKRSIELSKIYSLYRQDYCGCVYSKKAREIKLSEKNINNRKVSK